MNKPWPALANLQPLFRRRGIRLFFHSIALNGEKAP